MSNSLVRNDGSHLRVCMIAYTFYERDPRVQQYATALRDRGDTVDIVALNRNGLMPATEVLDGVTVYRIQRRTMDETGLLSYVVRLLRFLISALLFLGRKDHACHYDVVHVHNVPDFLVFASLFAKLRGAKVILDIHDLLPELYAGKFLATHRSIGFKLLVLVERCSAALANHVIVANHVWRDRLAARSSSVDKCSVVRNYPNLSTMRAAVTGRRKKTSGVFVLTYPGSLNWHQGVDVAVRAFARVADRMPDAEFHIYGEGPEKPALIRLAAELGMAERIRFHDFVSTHEVARIMAESDLAVEPKRANSAFGTEALSTKLLEFMAVGTPIIASRTKCHEYYYDESLLQYYDNDDEDQLAAEMLRLRNDAVLRNRLVSRASAYVLKNNWGVRKWDYLDLIDELAGKRTKAPHRRLAEA